MSRSRFFATVVGLSALGLTGTSVLAEPLSLAPTQSSIFDTVVRDAPYEAMEQETGDAALPANLRRQMVPYGTGEAPGTIVIDTSNTYLYLVLGGGKAMRYGIGVGREGFTWSGVKSIARKAEWPDWVPPEEMIARQPYLPRWMAGGPGNPLGARAMYLSGTLYRIHGTNAPSTIGQHVSSGCIRMLNEDVIDLYSRVGTGTKVVVLPNKPHRTPTIEASAARPARVN
jgi:lipoprotein-anchoring transpeptidase ErfK/SrfK